MTSTNIPHLSLKSHIYKCDECTKDFVNKFGLDRHKKSAHQGLRYRCFECGDLLKQAIILQNHYKMYHCVQTYCQHCSNNFATTEMILAPSHIEKCSLVKAVIPEHAQLQQQEGAGNSFEQLQKKPLIIEADPDTITNELKDEFPESLLPIYQDYWKSIKTNADKSDLLDHVYNFRIRNPEQIPYTDMLHDIYAQEPSSFRINAALGYILENIETGEQRYFYPEENNYQMLDRPTLISAPEDINTFIAELQNSNIEDKVSRPDTKWVAIAMPNITFFVTPIVDFIAGCKNAKLPHLVTYQRNNILTMQWDSNRNPYNDNLCFFRCLSYCLTGDTKSDDVKSLFRQYCLQKGLSNIEANFNGVPLTDIEDGTGRRMLENLFRVDIQLFNLTNNNTATCWKHVYPRRFEKMLNLDICFPKPGQVHFSFIRKLDHYAKRYKCSGCSRMFRGRRKLKQHIRGRKPGQSSCKLGKTEHKFKGGVYKNKETLFEEMEEADIDVKVGLRQCEYLAVFDFEALLLKQDIQTGAKLNFSASHKPVSWAMHSTVPGFEKPMFFCHKDPTELVHQFINRLMAISKEQDEILTLRYCPIFQQLFEKIRQCQDCINELKENGKDFRREKGYKNRLENLKKRLETYCCQLTIIGFNSKRYDLNMIKRQLYPVLVEKVRNKLTNNVTDVAEDDLGEPTLSDNEEEEAKINTNEFQEIEVDESEDETEGEDLTEDDSKDNDEIPQKLQLSWPKAIVNNNSYMCLTTPNFRFLDASNYLPAGSSLDGFLKMYQTKLKKLNFPYEWLNSFEKLSETQLPPIEAFYSSLKNEHCTEEEYQKCHQLWTRYNMKTMMDYLELYNVRDVEPFLIAVSRMRDDYWNQFNIDIYRDVVSLPGFTLRYLFNNTKVAFSLFREKDKELYYELKQSMMGGLSLVMTRLAIAGETAIRNNPSHIVGSIIGYDAASLYLGSQAGSMPCGFYDYWIPDGEGNFIKKISSKKLEVEWLEQYAYVTKMCIRHQGNNSQKRIGIKQLPVDGFCAETNTVFEFYGCYYHCHDCSIGLQNISLSPEEQLTRVIWDKEKEAYIKSLGYNLITIRECDYKIQRSQLLIIRQLLDPNGFRKYYSTYKVSSQAMLNALISGEVFGFAKIDIFTPDALKENYADYPPIIKHASIGREHIGDHMRAYCDATNQLNKPRDNLTSSYSGKGILMMTPMIRFLIQHGLIIENIHYVIQYDEGRPFEWFRDKVTEMRLKGDAINLVRDNNGQIMCDTFGNPLTTLAEKSEACSLAADTYKLLGNTGYGKSITNKEKHLETFFCDFAKAAECNRSPYIKRIKTITPDCYEVQMFKKSITMDLPIVIGLATYSNSKVRMLSFAYDCLLKFCDKNKYMWMVTDTDSSYIATESKSGDIREIIRPEMLVEFNQDYNHWFVDPTIPYTSRKSGLFKVEAQGTKMAALCSKTYMLVSDTTGKMKKSHKGLSHRLNHLQFKSYHDVLVTKQQIGGQNCGFRMRADGQMWTYHQAKLGLPYLYIKREVLPDGVNTKPLDI